MSTMLQYIEQQIRQSEAKPGTLVHIGAGTGSELPEYLNLNFNRIVLYEALPELIEELREKSKGYQQVSVEQAVVASQNGEVTFHRMNNPQFSSLKEQKSLNEYYPNLIRTPLQVEAVGLANVLNSQELSQDATNILVLEVLGSEYDLLTVLDEQLIQRFSWVIVRGLVKGRKGEGNSKCSSWMHKNDFFEAFTSTDIHPFCIQYFRRDDNAKDLKILQKKYTKMEGELVSERSRSEGLEAQLTEQARTYQNKQKDAEEKFHAQLEEKEKEISDMKEKLRKYAKEKESLEGKVSKLGNQNNDLEMRLEKLDEEVSKAEAQLELIKDVVIREKAF